LHPKRTLGSGRGVQKLGKKEQVRWHLLFAMSRSKCHITLSTNYYLD
jgi:hypothetical protein